LEHLQRDDGPHRGTVFREKAAHEPKEHRTPPSWLVQNRSLGDRPPQPLRLCKLHHSSPWPEVKTRQP
jgi:hypothetical protein